MAPHEQSSSLRAIIMGGSLGGLNAAIWLRHVGYDVDIFERSPTSLVGKGAGIVLNPQTVRSLQLDGDFDMNMVGLPLHTFRYALIPPAEDVVIPVDFRVTSYNVLLSAYRQRLGDDRYHLGRCVTHIAQRADGVDVTTANGVVHVCDLLVCADGTTSDARRLIGALVSQQYAGYIAWRGLVPATLLPKWALEKLSSSAYYHLRPDSHIVSYPIPISEDSGEAVVYLNWLWYRNWPAETLNDLMTDVHGKIRGRAVPCGFVKPQYVDGLRDDMRQLPDLFRTMLQATKEPFIQAIYDVSVDAMAHSRVCIIGDAAFTPRPHIAISTAKAADDAATLAEALVEHSHNVVTALKAWEGRRLALGQSCIERSREKGDQLQRGVSGVTKKLWFGLYAPGDSEMK